MILEVNNTFDERRLYFLKNSEPADPKSEYEDESEYETHEFLGNEIRVSSKDPVDKSHGKFSAVWPKDFHVSPFNSRKGTYSLSATDPFVNHLANGKLKASCGQVNNTITLSSSKEYPKLIARVFSTSESIDPYSLSEWQVFKFVLSWCWVGFVTFPRIVREAGKLFFRRKLHVWYRPEVLEDSLGRKETDYERYAYLPTCHALDLLIKLELSLSFSKTMSRIASNPLKPRFLSNSAPALPPCLLQRVSLLIRYTQSTTNRHLHILSRSQRRSSIHRSLAVLISTTASKRRFQMLTPRPLLSTPRIPISCSKSSKSAHQSCGSTMTSVAQSLSTGDGPS